MKIEEHHFTSGKSYASNIVVIGDDLHAERGGFVRAFWTESLDADTQVTVFGYCDSTGSGHRTLKSAAREVLRHYPHAECYSARTHRRITL
jgi:hypothetical protein